MKIHVSARPFPIALRTLSTALIILLAASVITLVPAVSGRQQAVAEGEVKLALEIAHIGLTIYEMAAFGGEIAF